jgi:hypothetical protein
MATKAQSQITKNVRSILHPFFIVFVSNFLSLTFDAYRKNQSLLGRLHDTATCSMSRN